MQGGECKFHSFHTRCKRMIHFVSFSKKLDLMLIGNYYFRIINNVSGQKKIIILTYIRMLTNKHHIIDFFDVNGVYLFDGSHIKHRFRNFVPCKKQNLLNFS